MVVNFAIDPAPLAILPGLMCDSRLFAGQRTAFPGVTIIDGFYSGARSIGAMADLALAQLPPRVSLLGHSMGARIALEIWRRAPERVARLALASTGVHPVAADEPAKRLALAELGRTRGMAALVAQWLPPMIGPAGQARKGLAEALSGMCEDAGLAVYETQIEALLGRPAASPVLSTITCPVLVIAGSEDSWSSPAQHGEIAEAIPGARLVIVPEAGHMLPAEQPGAFNAALAEWLSTPVTTLCHPIPSS